MWKTLTIAAIATFAIAATAPIPAHAGIRTNGLSANGIRTNGTGTGAALNGRVIGIELPAPAAAPR